MMTDDDWKPAVVRMRSILDRHGLVKRLGADSETLQVELADLLLTIEREHLEIAISGLREACLLHANQPELVAILRRIENRLLSRRKQTAAEELELKLCG